MFSTMGILSVAFTLIIGLNVVSIGTGQAAGTGSTSLHVMKKGEVAHSAVVWTWPNKVLPYAFSKQFKKSTKGIRAVEAAMKDLSDNTCIKFKKRTDEKFYLYFYVGKGCYTRVGFSFMAEKHGISLAASCQKKGVALHEIVHALGFHHEQGRPDRDDYVEIKWKNILKGREGNFQKYDSTKVQTLNQPYDYDSVMHYGDKTFSKNNKKTIVVKKAGAKIGQRTHISAQDLKDVRLLYKCPVDGGWSSWSSWTACSVTCGVGNKHRNRSCSNPTPLNGGKQCGSLRLESFICRMKNCPPGPLVNGGWSPWGSWSTCSGRCGGGQGVTMRSRSCTNPPPKNGGRCPGDVVDERRPCNNTRSCPDTNECLLGIHNCSRDSSCINTNGSYYCTCNKGYAGDGFTCTDEDECSLGKHNCVGLTKCQNEIGSFKCVCKSGYERKGTNCSDIDECTYKCSIYAACINTVGSFSCTCNKGFRGNGIICDDVDECAADKPPCHHKAYCNNDIGSYTCRCHNGYIGDGFRCLACKSGWTRYRNSCYKMFKNPDDKIRGTSLRSTCAKHGAKSLKIENAEETKQIGHAIMGTARGVLGLIGLTRAGGGPWKWDDGTPLGFEKWRPGQPKKDNNCAVIIKGEYGFWESVPCDKKHLYLCEYSPASDGNWANWGPWSKCSNTCGDKGHKKRNRTCTNPPPKPGGKQCIPDYNGDGAEKVKKCTLQPCPINGGWSAWHSWGGCSVSCALGRRYRERWCTDPKPLFGGLDCIGNSTGSEACKKPPCPVRAIDGSWSTWGNWGKCSTTCGKGTKIRERNCSNPAPKHGGKECEKNAEGLTTLHLHSCHTKPCPVDGGWSGWSNWTECSQTCGNGAKTRARTCTNPPPLNGGKICPSDSTSIQHASCGLRVCPIKGGWSHWGAWGECSLTCGGGGVKLRRRTCTSPAPKHGGLDCEQSGGVSNQTSDCRVGPCPIDGKWSKWGMWGLCSKTCGHGIQTRRRTCTDPAPSFGGADCVKDTTGKERKCNIKSCSGWQTGASLSHSLFDVGPSFGTSKGFITVIILIIILAAALTGFIIYKLRKEVLSYTSSTRNNNMHSSRATDHTYSAGNYFY